MVTVAVPTLYDTQVLITQRVPPARKSCQIRSLSTVNVDHVIEVLAFEDADGCPVGSQPGSRAVMRSLVSSRESSGNDSVRSIAYIIQLLIPGAKSSWIPGDTRRDLKEMYFEPYSLSNPSQSERMYVSTCAFFFALKITIDKTAHSTQWARN